MSRRRWCPSGFQNLVEAIYEAFLGIAQQVGRGAQRQEVLPLRLHDLHLPADRQMVRAVPLEQRDRPGRRITATTTCMRWSSRSKRCCTSCEDGERELSAATIAGINETFQNAYFSPIHFSDYETGSFKETHEHSDEIIDELREGSRERTRRSPCARSSRPTRCRLIFRATTLSTRSWSGWRRPGLKREVRPRRAALQPAAGCRRRGAGAGDRGRVLSGSGFKIIPPRTAVRYAARLLLRRFRRADLPQWRRDLSAAGGERLREVLAGADDG